MSLRHWRSSVASDSGVPKEANTFGKGILAALGRYLGQLVMQFGVLSPMKNDVKCFVIAFMVRSLSRRGLGFRPSVLGESVGRCHPMSRG